MADVGEALTQLPLMDEFSFRKWVSENRVPFDPDAKQPDYDMRGFYQGVQQENPHARTDVNPNDQQMHFTDYWKRPSHETFSRESKYAGPDAPRWSGSRLMDKGGGLLYDEEFMKLLRAAAMER